VHYLNIGAAGQIDDFPVSLTGITLFAGWEGTSRGEMQVGSMAE